MKKRLLALALIVILNSSFSSFGNGLTARHFGNGLTARQLNEFCGNDHVEFLLSCATYLDGFTSGIVAGHYLEFTEKDVSVGTIMDVFKKEMRHHPEKGDEGADLILSQLLTKYGWLRKH